MLQAVLGRFPCASGIGPRRLQVVPLHDGPGVPGGETDAARGVR